MKTKSNPWTPAEDALIVADYLTMLRTTQRGLPINKAAHNRALLPQLAAGRNRSSIEFKHQNISAVMVSLGEPVLRGYKPLANYQQSLVTAVRAALAPKAVNVAAEGMAA